LYSNYSGHLEGPKPAASVFRGGSRQLYGITTQKTTIKAFSFTFYLWSDGSYFCCIWHLLFRRLNTEVYGQTAHVQEHFVGRKTHVNAPRLNASALEVWHFIAFCYSLLFV